MDNVNTIVFDVGRVLVGIHSGGEKFGALMRAMGIRPEEAFDKYRYTAEVQRHMTGELTAEEFHRALTGRFGVDYDFEAFKAAWCDIFRPIPGMEELFGELSGRYRVGLLSDTDPIHWEYLETALPWMRTATKPALSFEVGYLKPHPAMFEAAAANCGADKAACLFIDDLLANVDGARCSGMPALRFDGPEKLRKALAGLGVL